MSNITCPSCQAQDPQPSGPSGSCSKCGAALLLGGRFALVGEKPAEQGDDFVDGASPLWDGLDVVGRKRVLVRVASVGDTSRLEREATVLRGLAHPGVPRVVELMQVEGVGRALVLSHPEVPSLESALESGLRSDTKGAQRFLTQLLEVLAYLHALSPPVFHRFVQPRAVSWDGRGEVKLYDFARATDVRADAASDPVLARAGYAPQGRAGPVALDLYGAGATTVHLLTRTPLDRLPHDGEGRPRFREAANVDERFARVLDRLLEKRFASAAEALAALRAPEPRSGVALVAVGASGLLVAIGGAVVFSLSMNAPAPPPAPAVIVQPRAPTPPPPPPPPAVVPTPPVPAVPAPPAPLMRPVKPPRRPEPVQSDQEILLSGLRRALNNAESDLVRCGAATDDRFRFEVEVGLTGRLDAVKPHDRPNAPSTRCVANVLGELVTPKPRAKPVKAEVTIYLRPSFRVTVF